MTKPQIAGELNPNYRHGHNTNGTSLTYWRWAAMIQRCTNPKNKKYGDYGGRGITVCQDWMKFENFLRDMGVAPSGSLLDRENNDGGYCKANCRWATKRQSGVNRRMTVNVTLDGRTMCVVEWSEELGIPAPTIYSRIERGETRPEMILRKPQQTKQEVYV